MAPIVCEFEVSRPPGEVFAYVTDPSRIHEWQAGVVTGQMLDGRPPTAGSRFTVTTRAAGTEQIWTLEITAAAPPRTWAVRGIYGPVQVTANLSIEPLGGSAGSRVTVTLDFQADGTVAALVPLPVPPQVIDEVVSSCRRLKERLDNG